MLRALGACALSVLVTGPGCSERPSPSRPNVILFLTDDQGWTGTSVQMDATVPESKSDFYRTPALVRLAREGMPVDDDDESVEEPYEEVS